MNVAMLNEQPSLLKSAALLPPRLSLGATMIHHGLSKLKREGMEQQVGMFEQLGIKPGKPWLLATGITELVAGVSSILGIATRFTAVSVIVTQAMAIAKVHRKNGFDMTKGGYEFNLALIAIALGTLMRGPGRVSLHSALERRVKRRELKHFRLLPRQRKGSMLLDALG
ncbi:DoxX family protein [Corallococcus sp. 4LFB]|uniref:DoxX family protein n=1 Tax=Corallococcus sp. 4LFB TaxID=3383249 RepID=UPI003977114C